MSPGPEQAAAPSQHLYFLKPVLSPFPVDLARPPSSTGLPSLLPHKHQWELSSQMMLCPGVVSLWLKAVWSDPWNSDLGQKTGLELGTVPSTVNGKA